ncbi:FliI/YscN family ATPase [Gimesia sp.]|uniref:FliI/YscN family ATPase n=1 Tax=Gimesia sp. TaxID=2024833 RepID=UPI000C3A6BAB|nr:FliI/YscN family ATPase [Gimesia sp.]MAX40235.1 EscN/YscN/HrcN family type III secretion system ATPase [Gimesia sp.]HBL42116.1 EscN/YscN/HrcN family type III secretion system ATPase [Planctomycetaceae bacterium]|tara:strand:+ start:30296 stop:31672 length:1377 start_codon:yes stop_codon:yes gene_type:complete
MFDVSQQIKQILPFRLTGRVTRVVGLTASVSGFPAPLGSVCAIDRENGSAVEAEVVGFQNEETLLLPYEDLAGIRRGDRVSLIQSVPAVAVGQGILGRVLDGHGRCIDGKNQAMLSHRANLKAKPISPLKRPRIDTPLSTGIRTIDGLLTCGKGQRLGIFAGSGVGKSTLMGQMARQSSADINVVCLVGERGREVREFLDRDLGPEGLARSVVIVATSDEPALIRLRAAHLATAVSEFFRDCGRDVLLMMDSVTRYALAQREIGLAAGEPPATRGYPPSVFSLLPKLLERSGRTDSGSITGFYTVLVEADDANEPISDTVRGILDGHIMLSRKLAHESHWPAIDVLQSISRSMNDVTSVEHQQTVSQIKKLMAAYQQSEDLISIGAYQTGSNPEVDLAIKMRPLWNEFLKQGSTEDSDFNSASEGLRNLIARMQQLKPMKTSEAGQPPGNEQTAEAAR